MIGVVVGLARVARRAALSAGNAIVNGRTGDIPARLGFNESDKSLGMIGTISKQAGIQPGVHLRNKGVTGYWMLVFIA